MMLARTNEGAVRSERGISSFVDAEEVVVTESRFAGSLMKTKPTAQRASPIAMIGTDRRRIKRRPTRSIKPNATQVMTKFVTATESEVRVGLVKPSIVKMVAEKLEVKVSIHTQGVRCDGTVDIFPLNFEKAGHQKCRPPKMRSSRMWC